MLEEPGKSPNSLYWRACCVGMIILSVLSFTPLVIPPGKIDPTCYGIPLTLWAGLLIAMAMIVLTIIATLVHPDRNYRQEDKK